MTPSNQKPPPALSWILLASATTVFVVSFLMSFYIFFGFLGGGRSWLAILQAFGLCFGFGAMLYIPAAIVFFMIKYVQHHEPRVSIGIASICISLPLVLYGIIGPLLGMPYRLVTFMILLYGLLVFYWGVRVLWQTKQPAP